MQEESFNEAKVIAFVASLFLTHRGYASVSQDMGTNGEIYLQDLWPKALTYDQISNSIATWHVIFTITCTTACMTATTMAATTADYCYHCYYYYY